MNPEDRFLVPADVIFQSIDGEVILVHLSRGTYHSLRGSGGQLFEVVARGGPLRELGALLARQTDGAASVIDAAVARFLEELLVLELVRPAAAAGHAAQIAAAPNGVGAAAAEKRPFEAPSVETFTDLKFLLNADPVHDVEASGWPVMAAQGQRRP